MSEPRHMLRVASDYTGDPVMTAEDDWVECWGCKQRFTGGTFQDRLNRWNEHATETGCAGDVE